MIRGKNLTLYVTINGKPTPVCLSKDCTIDINADAIETTTQSSGNWKSYDYTTRNATISHSGLTSFKKAESTIFFIDAILNSTKIFFSFSDFNNQGIEFSGQCIVNSANITSPHDSMSAFTASLTVDGRLRVDKKPIVTNLGLASEFGIKPQYCINGSGTLFPLGIYNVKNTYIGSAANKAQLVALWNADIYNQDYGVLTVTATDCNYTLTSTYNQDELPPYIIVDVNNVVPKYGVVITVNQVVNLPTTIAQLFYSVSGASLGITGHQWTYVSGPNVPTLNSSTGALSGLILGVYQFLIIITYSDGHQTSNLEQVTVNPQTVFNSLFQWGYAATDDYASVLAGIGVPTFQFSNTIPTNTVPQTPDFTSSAQNMYIFWALPAADNPFITWLNTGNNSGIFVNDSVWHNIFSINGVQYGMSKVPFQFDSFSSKLILQ